MTAAKLRLAMAAMGQPETKVGDLCQELGITRQTLYRHISPKGDCAQMDETTQPYLSGRHQPDGGECKCSVRRWFRSRPWPAPGSADSTPTRRSARRTQAFRGEGGIERNFLAAHAATGGSRIICIHGGTSID
jgi:hypothetical protein